MEQLIFGDGGCVKSTNPTPFYLNLVATFGTAICGIVTDIAVIITGFHLYRSKQRRFLGIYLCLLAGMISASLYLTLYIFQGVPFLIQETCFTNYMMWFFLLQWFFIFEHYKTSVYIEKRLTLSEKELETQSLSDLKHWKHTNYIYCSLLIVLSVVSVVLEQYKYVHNNYYGQFTYFVMFTFG